MIDLHAHVLPGIDDGPATLAETEALLAAARADGVTAIAATPHVRADYPTTPEQAERLLADVRALDAGVDVLPGAELDVEYMQQLDDASLRRFGLGGNAGLLLLEFPYVGWPLRLREHVFELDLRGFSVVLAHPERNAEVQEQPDRLREVVGAGVVVQVTAGSVGGRFGRRAAECAHALIRSGLAHLVASDVHGPSVREASMTVAVEAVGDAALARWLTEDVPAALLASALLPPRPQRRRTMRLPWHR